MSGAAEEQALLGTMQLSPDSAGHAPNDAEIDDPAHAESERPPDDAEAFLDGAGTPASQPALELRTVEAKAERTEPPGEAPADTGNRPADKPEEAKAVPQQAWQVTRADRSLKTLLSRWSEAAGWQISWELPVDYPLIGTKRIEAGFEQAVEAVVTSMGATDFPFKVIFYKGNSVVRVIAKGDR